MACAYPKDPYPELLHLAQKVKPKLLFCDEHKLNWIPKLETDLGHSVLGIVMDFKANVQQTLGSHLEHLLNYDHKQSKSREQIPVACVNVHTQPALILMSSGTTGKPKAVPATHWNCMADMVSFGANVTQPVAHVMVTAAALDYVSGRLLHLGAIESGYKLVLLEYFEPRKYLEAVQRFRVTSICAGVSSFYNLITHNSIDDYDLSSVRSILPMGAKVPFLGELKEFLSKHPHIKRIKVGYGTSEFSVAATALYSVEDYLKISDVCGRLLPGCQVKVIDTSTGQCLDKNQIGLIHLKSQSLFPGYYDLQELQRRQQQSAPQTPFIANDEIFDAEGYYITGDIGYFNDKEELCIVGRQKEVMSCRGAKKVMPRELEEIISEHECVASVCVIGIPKSDEPLVACPRAFVVPKSSYYGDISGVSELSFEETTESSGANRLCKLNPKIRQHLAEDLVTFVNERVGWEKQLTGGVVILDSIPLLRETGKMNKGFLRCLTEKEVDIYANQS